MPFRITQNQAWVRMVAAGTLFSHFRKGIVAHNTIDNNDVSQETVTVLGQHTIQTKLFPKYLIRMSR